MNLERLNRITIEEGKCGGRPCIRGLRMRVTDVLELLGSGASFEEILEDYPFLDREDILAALEYAARQTDHVVIRASGSFWLIANCQRPLPRTSARRASIGNMFWTPV
jgi:uncharacterized protein (DUF433 family)